MLCFILTLNLITNIYQMANQIVMFQEMIVNKKPNLTQLGMYLKKIKQSQIVTLQKKSIIVISLARNFFLSCRLWLEELEKFKHEIFYSHFLKSKDKRVRNTTTGKKRQSRTNYQKVADVPQLTLEEMVQRIDEANQTQQSSLATPKYTPKKGQVRNETIEPITVPPFDEQISGQIAEQIATLIKSQQKQDSKNQSQDFKLGWKPDLEAYKSILDITPNQTDLSAKKRRMSRTKVRNQAKIVRFADKKLQITQGDERVRELQLLTTKVKLSKEKQAENLHYFSNTIQKINPLLLDKNYLLSSIVQKKSQLPKLSEEPTYSPIFQFSMNFLNSSNQKQQKQQQEIYVNLQDNASISNQLQTIIKNKIDSELFLKPLVSFQKFSEAYNVKKQIKGQLFFQLLHTDYRLVQDSPETFSDIKIFN